MLSTFMARKHPRDSFSRRLALITFSPSRPISKLHSPINTHMGSCRLNTYSSRLNHSKSEKANYSWKFFVLPSGKDILALGGSGMYFFPLSLPYAAAFMKVSNSAIIRLEGDNENGLNCPNQHHLILCLCRTYLTPGRTALHCALAPCCSGEGDSSPSAADKRWPLAHYFPSSEERSLSMKATVASMYVSWLKLVSGTVNEVVPASARQAIAWTARKDFCKTNVISALRACVGQIRLLVLPSNDNVSIHSPGNGLSVESHTQTCKAEHGWEMFWSA